MVYAGLWEVVGVSDPEIVVYVICECSLNNIVPANGAYPYLSRLLGPLLRRWAGAELDPITHLVETCDISYNYQQFGFHFTLRTILWKGVEVEELWSPAPERCLGYRCRLGFVQFS